MTQAQSDRGGASYAGTDGATGAAPEAPQADAGADSESITNTQVDGVDEGGIIKNYKDFLVVLRRGRLFTIRVKANGEPALTPTAMIDAFAPTGADHGGQSRIRQRRLGGG